MPFPSPPWKMRAQMWLSLFAVTGTGRGDRPSGLYGAAVVDYQEGSPLTYHELLVARLHREGPMPRVRITDIWVDSPQSLAGGRALWAIPKELADLPLEVTDGTVERMTAHGYAAGERIATARFRATPRAALLRAPFAATISQLRDGAPLLTPMRGTARTLPCRGSWDFDAQGPLGFLHGRRPVASFRLADIDLTFG